MRRFIYIFALGIGCANTAGALTLDAYLKQVRAGHSGYKGARQNRQGARDSATQADLITSFRLESNYQLQRDKQLSQDPSLTYDRLDSEYYSLGVAKTTTFGLDARLSYDVNRLKYVNPDSDIPGGNQASEAMPTLKLTQSLWQNAFGRLSKNQVKAAAAQAEFEKQNSQATMDSLVQRATNAYWNLVLQKEIVEIQKAALKQSQELYNYNVKRSQMKLTDLADSLQSKATLEAKKLDVQTAIDNEEALLREFNLLRNKPPEEDPGALPPLDWNAIANTTLPENYAGRSDVRAAKAQAEASVANYKIAEESNKPLLNLFGSYSRNGRASSNRDAISNSYSANRPTTAIGLTLSVPLDFISLKRAGAGARAQAQGAQGVYQQMVLDQEAGWRDLRERVNAAQRRTVLSEAIVAAQLEKLEYERSRLHEGRTSTFQVLLFEQDYIDARMARVQNVSELVSLLSQVRLYTDTEEGGAI